MLFAPPQRRWPTCSVSNPTTFQKIACHSTRRLLRSELRRREVRPRPTLRPMSSSVVVSMDDKRDARGGEDCCVVHSGLERAPGKIASVHVQTSSFTRLV